jgi:hypothetical protein
MILLWGVAADPPLAAVSEALAACGESIAFLDQHDVLATTLELTVDMAVRGQIQVGDEELDLHAVRAAYLRPHDARRLPELQEVGPESAEWRHAVQVEEILLTWADLTPARVVNRPRDMAVNYSKPYQLQRIRAEGFHVPDTLITTDPTAVEAFQQRHGTIIYKSISGQRSIVSRLRDEQRSRLADVRWCPTQFQQYIPGMEYRVHVVGAEVFPCEVHTTADDYRYPDEEAGALLEIRACRLPDEIEARCREMAARMGLHVAGIDLRLTPDGDWYCFEVNPSPAFTYYQGATGQPIAEAVARLLVDALVDADEAPAYGPFRNDSISAREGFGPSSTMEP